jgi:hypothetical protein
MAQATNIILYRDFMSFITRDTTVTLSLPTITALAGAAEIVCNAPFPGSVVSISGAVNDAFTATDIVITGRIGTNSITNGVVTLANAASGFGTTATATPTAANVFAAGDVLNCTITGGVGAVNGAVTFILRRSG